MNQLEQAHQKVTEANALINEAIMNTFLFTWRWWLGIALFIVPWIVWIIFRKKESTDRLLYAGLSSILLGLIIEMFALSMGMWSYPVKFIPNAGLAFLPYHFSTLPVGVMFTLQWMPKINAVLKGILLGIVCAYGIEPFFAKSGFYNPKNWYYFYDVFIYFFIYMVANWLSSRNYFDQLKSKEKVEHNEELNFHFLNKKQKAK
ncbi:CBO0543 family protein [Paenibacillus sp. SYP-B3998]|uniref:CBO0543 family protein n=1 Tax=Paenibacillus sp. SYP-B3998 TaxID=2678564 RepID=UPI0019684CC6|nr:CBO0543 family protein [Paenibacillus sp. SYP-B3998]